MRAKEFVLNLYQDLGILIFRETSLGSVSSNDLFWNEDRFFNFEGFPNGKRVVNMLLMLEGFLSSKAMSAKSWLRLLGHMSSLGKL